MARFDARWMGGSWLALAGLAGTAHANDSTFGGAGADLVPVSEQRVQMVSEDILMTALGEDWSVDASYVFRNLASSDVQVQVGFPEYRCERESEVDCKNLAFQDLVTTVDGTPVRHRKGKLTRAHGWADFLGAVWLFDVRFPAGQVVKIRHRYRLPSSGDLGGTRYTSYVTRTGRSWAGAIEHARFTAHLPPYTRYVMDVEVPGLTASAPRLVREEGAASRVEVVLEGKHWKPEGGVFIGYDASSTMTLEPLAALPEGRALFEYGEGCFSGERVPDPQSCLNAMYAARGYAFKDAALARQYYSGDPSFRILERIGERAWVRDATALPGFSTAWFDAEDVAFIKLWTQQLAADRAALARSTAAGGAAAAERAVSPSAGVVAAPGGASAPLASTDGRSTSAAVQPARHQLATAPAVVVQELRTTAEPVAAGATRRGAAACGVSGGGRVGTARTSWVALGCLTIAWRLRRRTAPGTPLARS